MNKVGLLSRKINNRKRGIANSEEVIQKWQNWSKRATIHCQAFQRERLERWNVKKRYQETPCGFKKIHPSFHHLTFQNSGCKENPKISLERQKIPFTWECRWHRTSNYSFGYQKTKERKWWCASVFRASWCHQNDYCIFIERPEENE